MPKFHHPDDKSLSFVMRRKPFDEGAEVREFEYLGLDADFLTLEQLSDELATAAKDNWVFGHLDEYNSQIVLKRQRSEEEIQKDKEEFQSRLAKWEEDFDSNMQTLNELLLLKRKQEELQDKLKV